MSNFEYKHTEEWIYRNLLTSDIYNLFLFNLDGKVKQEIAKQITPKFVVSIKEAKINRDFYETILDFSPMPGYVGKPQRCTDVYEILKGDISIKELKKALKADGITFDNK